MLDLSIQLYIISFSTVYNSVFNIKNFLYYLLQIIYD